MRYAPVLLLLLSIGLPSTASGQDRPHAPLQALQFEHLTVDDGLAGNWVTRIYQDRLGFMWFGTLNGLSRYDGYTFTVYQHDPDDGSSGSKVGAFPRPPLDSLQGRDAKGPPPTP